MAVAGLPQTIGKYRILRELGRGGMGVVYLAEDENLHREVAIKMVTPSADMAEDYLRRFKREAQSVGSLSHPNIVHINAFENIDGQFVIEMPLIAGGSLRDTLSKGITIGSLTRIIGDVLSALSACHTQGIVHRDVKPSNILLTTAGQGMLTDFGVATLMEGEWQAVVSGTSSTAFFGGTPQYISPDAWSGETPAPHHDLYSLGIVAHEVLLGKAPFRASTPFELMGEIKAGNLPSLQEEVPELSSAFVSVIESLVNSTTMTNSNETLQELMSTPEWNLADDREQDTITFTSKTPPIFQSSTSRPGKASRRKRGLWLTGLVASLGIVALIVALAWKLVPTSEHPPSRPLVETESQKIAQEFAFHSSLIDVEGMDNLWALTTPDTTRVYRAIGTLSPTAYPVMLFARDDESYGIIGLGDQSMWGLNLVPTDNGDFSATGTWASYSTEGAIAFRWAAVNGTAIWNGNFDAPPWLSLDVVSQSDGATWTEKIVLSETPDKRTDTWFLAAMEATPYALPVVYTELPARRQANPWNFSELLPAVHDARLSAAALDAGASINVDGAFTEMAWETTTPGHSYTGRPKTAGATLRAVHDGEHLYLGLRAPILSDTWRLRLAFLERASMPMGTAIWEKGTFDADGEAFEVFEKGKLKPLADGWHGKVSERSNQINAEIAIPLRHRLLPSSLSSRVVHINVSLFNVGEDGREKPVAAWGWPVVDKVSHGCVVHLEESTSL